MPCLVLTYAFSLAGSIGNQGTPPFSVSGHLLHFSPAVSQLLCFFFGVSLSGVLWPSSSLPWGFHVIALSPGGRPSPKFSRVPLVDVFVTMCFLGGRVVSPLPNPSLFSAGLGDRPWQGCRVLYLGNYSSSVHRPCLFLTFYVPKHLVFFCTNCRYFEVLVMPLCKSMLYAENVCCCCVICSNPRVPGVAGYTRVSSSLPVPYPFQRPS